MLIRQAEFIQLAKCLHLFGQADGARTLLVIRAKDFVERSFSMECDFRRIPALGDFHQIIPETRCENVIIVKIFGMRKPAHPAGNDFHRDASPYDDVFDFLVIGSTHESPVLDATFSKGCERNSLRDGSSFSILGRRCHEWAGCPWCRTN